MKHYLSICTLFRNEATYLQEWIEFHRLVGVEHFYLYNNMSDDSFMPVLQEYLTNGTVTLHEWDIPYHRGSAQLRASMHCIQHYQNRSRWMAFIDLDEFLFSPVSFDLNDVLKEYEAFPGVVVHWQVYGSSGRKVQPNGLVIENYNHRAPTDWVRNRRVKSIADPRKVVLQKGSHFFRYKNDERAVTENFEPVKVIRPKQLGKPREISPAASWDPFATRISSVEKVSVEKLRINHYLVKSWEEYERKAMRHSTQRKYHTEFSKGMNYFSYHDRNEIFDPILHRYLSQLRDRLTNLASTRC